MENGLLIGYEQGSDFLADETQIRQARLAIFYIVLSQPRSHHLSPFRRSKIAI
jgi:hypothetical protein